MIMLALENASNYKIADGKSKCTSVIMVSWRDSNWNSGGFDLTCHIVRKKKEEISFGCMHFQFNFRRHLAVFRRSGLPVKIGAKALLDP